MYRARAAAVIIALAVAALAFSWPSGQRKPPVTYPAATAAAPAPARYAARPGTTPVTVQLTAYTVRRGYAAFRRCVITRESGGRPQVFSPSGSYWGLFQFSRPTWIAYGGRASSWGHASAAAQNRVFARAMATPGGAGNWSRYDGCRL